LGEGTPDEHAQARYEHALELAAQVRDQWESEGSPLLVEWSNGNVSEHPLVKLLRESERDCERFARVLSRNPRGRKPVAALEASVGRSPATKLRRVS
jgi:hypothetical protein